MSSWLRWTRRATTFVSLIVIVDLLVSAGIREARIRRAERETLRAEAAQEPYRGTDWGRAYWEEIARYTEKWDPYVVYRVGEMHGQFINVDNGVRRTYNPVGSPDVHRHLIFVFGGSAAWGHGARDIYTLPSWLARVAEERGDVLEVRNYAESGWVNWQGIVYLLEKLANGERPEAVVFYSGVNETLNGRQWPHERRPIWDAELYPTAMRQWALQRNRPLLGVWEYYRNTSLALSTLFPPSPAIAPAAVPAPNALAASLASDYEEDQALVEALGREYGFATLFVWQVTVGAKKTLSAQERRYAGWLPSSPETVPALAGWSMPKDLRDSYDAVGARVTSRHGVVDLSHMFDDTSSTAFIDWMHPSESGNERIARALYDRLAPELAERKRGAGTPR